MQLGDDEENWVKLPIVKKVTGDAAIQDAIKTIMSNANKNTIHDIFETAKSDSNSLNQGLSDLFEGTKSKKKEQISDKIAILRALYTRRQPPPPPSDVNIEEPKVQ